MNAKSITIAAFTALLTVITLGGSVWGFIFIVGPNSVTRSDVISSNGIPVILIAELLIYLCGGGLWGLGIARLMNGDAKSMVKTCALSWSATVFIFAGAISFGSISLGSLSSLAYILPRFPHSPHYSFLLIFVPTAGIVAAINGYVVTGKLGFKELRKSVGMYTGMAAALGFLTVGFILLFGLGWEVGQPVYGEYGMLLLLLICCIGAALSGGASLGWMLSRAGSVGEKM